MHVTNLFTDERAVSPVVGVALLIAIAVILAAVIGAVVLGLGSTGAETPQAQLNAELNTTMGQVNVSHNGGDPLQDEEIVYVDSAGNEVQPSYSDGELTAGETEGIQWADDKLSIVWKDPDSDARTVLEEFEF